MYIHLSNEMGRLFNSYSLEIEGKKPVGHPTWSGELFRLLDEETWGKPDEEEWTTCGQPIEGKHMMFGFGAGTTSE